MFNKV